MEDKLLNIGDLVLAIYKTGEYVGEIMEIKRPVAIVKVLAVMKHPTQGDLHNPMEVDVQMFHQRRALSFQEKARVPLIHIQPYHRDIPDYQVSLEHAVQADIHMLHRTEKWAIRSRTELEILKKEYNLGQ